MKPIILNSTEEALEYGACATLEQIEDLKCQRDTHRQAARRMIANREYNQARVEATHGQFCSEALSVAKGEK